MSKKRFDLTAFAYDKRGRLLAVGRNSYIQTHPLQAKFAKKAGRPQAIYVHAEMHAIAASRKQIHTLEVFRYNSKGERVTAKPCSICELAIKEFGIKKVVYK